MAGSEAAQKPSAGSYSVSPFVKKEVHDQIANRSAKARVSWNWYDTWHEEHHRAFVVAKLCKADLLQEVHDSLQKAIDEGQTFEEWRKEIQPKLEGRWIGKTEGELWDEMEKEDKKRLKEQAKEEGRPDPEPTGKQRDKEITPKRLETIYRTNMKVAHVAGQYQSLIDKAELYPYWQYHTQEDDRVRGSHAVLNNKVFRYDDPFWDTHFPPNGWRCRCYVLSLNERGLKRQGLSTDDVIDSSKLKTREDESAGGHTKLTYIIDGKDASTADGWNYNPGKIQNIDSVAKDKIDGYDPELGKQVEGDIKEEAQPKPTAPKQPSAVPSQDKKRPEPAKKPTPKPAAPKPAVSTEKTKAEDKPKVQPAVSQPKPSDKPAVKPAAAPKPKPAAAEPRPAAAPKPAAPKPAPIKPLEPSAPRVVKPLEPAEHPELEETKEENASILTTIKNGFGVILEQAKKLLNHLRTGTISTNKKINGAHQRSAFEKCLTQNNGKITSETEVPTFPGCNNIIYTIDEKRHQKSVYDDDFEQEYINRASEAYGNSDYEIERDDGSLAWEAQDSKGLWWTGSFKQDGTPITTHPITNKDKKRKQR